MEREGSVVRSEHNGGFGHGIDVGVRRALQSTRPPKYVYVLNADAFPERNAVRELIAVLDEAPEMGLVGSKVRAIAGDKQVGAFRFPTLVSEFESTINFVPVSRLLRRWRVSVPLPSESLEVDWVSGTSFMVRREILDSVGLFDDGFFLYFEEIDFCKRVRDGGFKNVFVPGQLRPTHRRRLDPDGEKRSADARVLVRLSASILHETSRPRVRGPL